MRLAAGASFDSKRTEASRVGVKGEGRWKEACATRLDVLAGLGLGNDAAAMDADEEPGARSSLSETAAKLLAVPTLWLPYATAFAVLLHFKLHGLADVSWVGVLTPLVVG